MRSCVRWPIPNLRPDIACGPTPLLWPSAMSRRGGGGAGEFNTSALRDRVPAENDLGCNKDRCHPLRAGRGWQPLLSPGDSESAQKPGKFLSGEAGGFQVVPDDRDWNRVACRYVGRTSGRSTPGLT